jgi:Icc-related predicted phosphoesterase
LARATLASADNGSALLTAAAAVVALAAAGWLGLAAFVVVALLGVVSSFNNASIYSIRRSIVTRSLCCNITAVTHNPPHKQAHDANTQTRHKTNIHEQTL